MNKLIIFLHSMWAGSWSWKNYMNFFFDKDYDVQAIDLPFHNHDLSHDELKLLGKKRLNEYYFCAKNALLDASNKYDEIYLIGHSLGGLLAQKLAEEQTVKGIVCINTAWPRGIIGLTYWSVLRIYTPVFHRVLFELPVKLSKSNAHYAMFHMFADLESPEYESIYSKLIPESGRAIKEVAFGMKGAKIERNKVICPVLLVASTDDRIVPWKIVKKLYTKGFYKNMTYRQFDGHAHWIIQEPGWEKPAAYIEDWLKKST